MPITKASVRASFNMIIFMAYAIGDSGKTSSKATRKQSESFWWPFRRYEYIFAKYSVREEYIHN